MRTQVRTSAASARDALDARLAAAFGPSTPETEALIAASIVAHSLPERERKQLAELAGGPR